LHHHAWRFGMIFACLQQRITSRDGWTLVFLPARSPELQPAERLWPLVDAVVANRAFTTLEALEETLVARCRVLQAQEQALFRGATCYHWWPQVACEWGTLRQDSV
jgi:hypothetical protein